MTQAPSPNLIPATIPAPISAAAYRPNPSSRLSRPRGLTLIELLITITVLATVSGLAMPTFDAMWLDSQRTAAVNSLLHSAYLARSLAIQRNKTITICRSADGHTCSHQTDDWQAGWIVFVNKDDDQPPARDANEAVVEVVRPRNNGTITSNRTSYSFRPSTHRVINGSVVFCDRRGSAHARAVIINSAGRPRVSARDSDNQPLRCAGG